MSVRRDAAARPRPGLLYRELGGETVLLDVDRGLYYGLDDVGTSIWRALRTSSGEPRPLEAVHAEVLGQYEVEAERLWVDLLGLVGELEERGLVEISEP